MQIKRKPAIQSIIGDFWITLLDSITSVFIKQILKVNFLIQSPVTGDFMSFLVRERLHKQGKKDKNKIIQTDFD